jgi:hypothetical protein
LILSNKYLEELRLLPNTILSNAIAQFQVNLAKGVFTVHTECCLQNLSGHYTHMHVILHSDLHARALMRDLTPNVAFYTTRSKAEFDHAFYQLLSRKTGKSLLAALTNIN